MAPGGGKRKRGHGGDHYQSSPNHDRRQSAPRDQDNNNNNQNNRRGQNSNRGGRGGSNFGDRGAPTGRPQPQRPGSAQSTAQSPRAGPQQPHNFQTPPTPVPAQPRMTTQAPPTPIAPPTPVLPEVNASAGPNRLWEALTPERLEVWHTTGHTDTVNEIITKSLIDDNYLETCEVVQEVIFGGMDGRIACVLATNVLADAIKINREDVANGKTKLEISGMIFDTLPILDSTNNINAIIGPLIPDYLSLGEARLQLPDNILVSLGLVSSSFKGRQVKVHTNILYRVQKYNLSREESEGFAKLITEVFMAEYGPGPLNRVEETIDRISSLIGSFDLDPNRVLDIILDVFANGVVANWRFFVQLLRSSSWWPEDVSTEDKESLYQDPEFFDRLEKKGLPALFEHPDGEDILTRRGGNKVAAQLIGFKFKFYTMPGLDLDSASNQLPDNLVAMTAILIKIGFISFRDLYPHLSPDDETMKAEFDDWKRENDSKGRSGAMNALLMASVLTDDTVPPPRSGQGPAPAAETKKPEEEAKPEEPSTPAVKPKNQKLALLNALLAAGALPESLFLFGFYPKIVYPHPEVADNLHRLLHFCIDDVYKPLEPARATEVGTKKVISTDPALKQAFAPLQPLVPAAPIKVTKYLLPFFPGKEPDPTREYRYFWEPEWTTDLPICKSERDVRILCFTLIRGFSQTRIANDVKLMSKLVRIGIAAVKTHGAQSTVAEGWANVLKYILLPGLSLSGSNSAICNEIFELMELYPFTERWKMYTFWSKDATWIFPELKSKTMETTKETKNILKRLSTTNVREMARKMSKITYSNPVTAFMVVIGQIESYDNLIEVVVDSARHFSKLGFDAFTYAILNKMAEDRGRMQQDGLLVSKWLQALATFCGRLYKRYPELDPSPILIFIAKKLLAANSSDLIVLQEMIKSMAGIVGESNLSDVQIMGLYGSENLRAKILGQLGDKRYSSRDSAKRLANALMNDQLAGKFLILLGVEIKTVLFRSDLEKTPIKIVANMYDEIMSVTNMFVDMLNYTLDFEQWAKAVPSVDEFINKFGVEPRIAWHFCRAHIREQLKREGMLFPDDDKKALPAPEPKKKEEKAKVEKVDNDGEVVMTDANGETTEPAKDEDVAMADGPSPAEEEKNSPFSPLMLDLMERLKPSMPEDTWNKISISFYTTFWQLSMYELHCPITPYDEEIKLLNNEIVRVIPDKNMSTHSRKRETDRLRSQADKLSQDMKLQIRLQMSTVKRINREAQHWFAAENLHPAKLPNMILQNCILPRMVLSPHDASFCAKFIKRMHVSGTPKFWTLTLYDKLFEVRNLQAIIYMNTEREVENFGRFLAEVMADFTTWHRSKTSFEKECHGKGNLPGFAKQWGGPLLDYEDFRRVLYKWHKQLYTALKNSLRDPGYMHVRNATIVLKHLNKSFPVVEWTAKGLVDELQTLSVSETREDLKITATALLSLLKRRQKEWVQVQQFQLSVADGAARSPANPPNSKGGTPIPGGTQGGAATNLNPAVTPFKPGNANAGLPQLTVHAKTSKEVEDGEIDDLPSAKTEGKPDVASSISGLTPLQPKVVKDISGNSGRSPTPQPRSQTPNRDSRGRSDSRARNNDLAPSNNEQRRGNSPRPPLELFPGKERDQRDSNRRDEGSRGKHDESRRERNDSRADRMVLPQAPSSLPAKPNTPMPPIPRPGAHRPEPESGRGRQDTREPRPTRHGGSPRRESRNTPRDQLPDLIDELNAKQAQQRGGGRRAGSDYRSRSPDSGRKREQTVQEQRMDAHNDGNYARIPAGPRGDGGRDRQSHGGRDSFGGNRPPAGPSDHGRLNQDPNHGRLNQPDNANIPSGPRGGRQTGQTGGGNQGFGGNNNVPNGPRTGRTSLTLNNRAPGNAPSAPAGGSSAGPQQQQQGQSAAMPMHPDRARAFAKDKGGPPTTPLNTNIPPQGNTPSSAGNQGNNGRSNSGTSPTTGAAANVHPSRLAVIGHAAVTEGTPVGPRGELPSPTSGNRSGNQQGTPSRGDRRESTQDDHHHRRRARGLQDILSSGGNNNAAGGSPGSNVPSEPGQGRRRGRGNTQGGQSQGPGIPGAPNSTSQGQASGSAGGSDDGRRREHRERSDRDNRDRDSRDNRDRDGRDNRDRDGRDQRKSGGSGQPGQSGSGRDNRERDGHREREPRERDHRDHRERDREGREGRSERDNRDHGRERGGRDRDDRRNDGRDQRGERDWDERARRDGQGSSGGQQSSGQSRQGNSNNSGGNQNQGGQSNNTGGGGGNGGPGPNQHGQKRPHRDGDNSRTREDAKRSRRG